MFKTDILFSGFYGYQNTGDDAFVEVSSWGAKKYWGKSRNRFLAKQSMLPKTVIPSKGYPLELRKTYRLQADFLLKNTQSFILAGGSTLHKELPSSNLRMKALSNKFKNNIKVGGIGVSVGPFKTVKDEKAVIDYLKRIDFLAVRDQTSFDFVKSISNLPYDPVNAFDLAAILPLIYIQPKNIPNVRKTIGISVCQYESLQEGMNIQHEEKRNSMLISLIRELDEKDDLHFVFYVINGNEAIGDLALTKEIIASSNPASYEIFHYHKETQLTWNSISNCDFVISTRLHAAIFACFAGIPFMLNEYHRKCGDFIETVGYNNSYRLYNSDYDVKQKAIQVLSIINDNNYIIPSNIEEMSNKALLNFTQIIL